MDLSDRTRWPRESPRPRILRREDRISRDERVGAGAPAVPDRVTRYPPIDFQHSAAATFRQHAPRTSNLIQRVRNELLAAESGVHSHYQDEIDLLQIRLDVGDAGGRIDGEPDLFAERTDFPDQGSHLIAQFKRPRSRHRAHAATRS